MNKCEYYNMDEDTIMVDWVYSRSHGWVQADIIGDYRGLPIFAIDGKGLVASPVFVDDTGSIDPDAPACVERCTSHCCDSCTCACAGCRHIPENQGRDWAWVCA